MSRETVDVVRRYYDAMERRDLAEALALVDPEVEIEYRGQLIDKDATYRGHAGMLELLRSIVENFEDFHVEIEEYIDRDDLVVAALHQRAVGKTSGAQVDVRIGQLWTVRRGKLVRWRIYRSKEEALAAVEMTDASG